MDYDYIDSADHVILFLHGWGGSKSSFYITLGKIENFSLCFISFPGFGNSTKPKTPLFVDDYKEELKRFIDSVLPNKKISIVCHSFGARVAAKLINDYPFLVKKLVIVDGAGLKPRRPLSYYLKVHRYKRLKKQVLKGKKDKKVLEKYGSADYKQLDNIMKQTFINVVNEDLKKCFKSIKCETLIFWGEKDKETPLYMAKKLNRLIKNSMLYVVKNGGHFSYLDDSEAFIYNLNNFLAN